MGVPVAFAWPDGTDTRTTEAKPGEQYALAWPLFAAGNGYRFTVDGGRAWGYGAGHDCAPRAWRPCEL